MRIKLLLLLSVLSLQAQVGIGTNTPRSKLEVNGDIKIGNEGKPHARGERGMLRWSDANVCFEGHNGSRWKCLSLYNKDHEVLLLRLRKSGKLFYAMTAEAGRTMWYDGNFSNTADTNVLALEFDPTKQRETDTIVPSRDSNEVIDTEVGKIKYSDNGTITIMEDGLYKISYRVSFINVYVDEKSTPFNGDTGSFHTWVTKNNNKKSGPPEELGPHIDTTVFKGARMVKSQKSKDSGGDNVEYINDMKYINNDSHIVYLKKYDQIKLRFTTHHTNSMNPNLNNIYIDKDDSFINIWKL